MMELNERYIHGALSVEAGERGLLPRRFTEEQLDGYRVSELRLKLARSCAGVTVEFDTDARWAEVSLYLRFVRPGRQVSFTLYADGNHAGTLTFPTACEGEMMKARFRLPGRACRAQIWLDPLALTEVTGLDVSPGAYVKPVPARRGLYMAFGDSITQGMQAADAPARPYPMQIARALDTELMNLGVCGGTFQPGLMRDVGLCPSLISVAYGVNDRNLVDTRAHFEENVTGFFEGLEALYPGVPTLVVLPLLCTQDGDTSRFATLQEIRCIIREAAQAHPGLCVLPGQDFMPLDTFFFRDGIHPTDAGFDRMTGLLLDAFSEPLGRTERKTPAAARRD